MYSLSPGRVRSVLCLGAHPDDIEIGCGATITKLFTELTEVNWVVFSGDKVRSAEAKASAACLLKKFARGQIEVLGFEDGHFPAATDSIKREFIRLAKTFNPDLIFTHCLHDRHQDHRVLSELTWQVFRNHTILEYEIPKFEGDLGHPNVFVPVDEDDLMRKIDCLFQSHQSQLSKHWFDRELFQGLARLRGSECAARYAEAFHSRKLVLQ